ncbi:hypothetical protein [Guggenheimella bovis]
MNKISISLILFLLLSGCSSQAITLEYSDEPLEQIEVQMKAKYPELKVIRKLDNALFLETKDAFISITENDLNDKGAFAIEFDRR